MSNQKIKFEVVKPTDSQVAEIRDFYDKNGEHVHLKSTEKILIALQLNKVVAAVRLVKNNNFNTLRTLFVDKHFRKQGLATQLLHKLLRVNHGKALYCLAYPHVKNIYLKYGFNVADKTKLPHHLRERYYRYIKEFEVVAMKRKAS